MAGVRGVAACATVLLAAAVAGCGSGDFAGAYNLPLPGGADLGGHPYRVVADFADVLDLVPQAAVKVNDVAVGRVEKIDLPAGGWTARVTMLVNGDVHLPANAEAHLELSSLLGEKYVQLIAPDGASGTLSNGDEIPLARTNRNPEVEEVLGALSLLLNGGGIDQLHTITTQLNDAMSGNEPQIHSMLQQIQTLASNLDAHRSDITAALDALNRLSATLAARDQQIGTVLDSLAPGLAVLNQQREQLVTMLQSLDRLSGVAVDVINRSKDDFVADLQSLAPILRQLANAGQALPQALQVLLTYPFSDAVLDDIKGDYLNVYLSVSAIPGTQIVAPLVPDALLNPSGATAGVQGGTPSGAASPSVPPPLPLPPVSPTAGAPATSPTAPGSAPGSSAPGSSAPGSSVPGSPTGSAPGAPPGSPSDSPSGSGAPASPSAGSLSSAGVPDSVSPEG
ncbi:MCE family protein [Rugosimonospora africana]|uniref:MCE family protein n=1 Tax=Rugosimonospora africana TaxID=556532 RepID=UPI001EF2980F|nr:MCE family protein [Rugosimonospora africana]